MTIQQFNNRTKGEKTSLGFAGTQSVAIRISNTNGMHKVKKIKFALANLVK